MISAGKYHTKFYHKVNSYFSSSLGGLCTFILALTIGVIGFTGFLDILNRRTYHLQR